jgi:hypothetical protein
VPAGDEKSRAGVTVMFFADPSGNAIQLVKRTTPLLDG